AAVWRHWVHAAGKVQPFRTQTFSSCDIDELAIERMHPARSTTTQLARTRRDRIEHRLHVTLRLINHSQNVAGRRKALLQLIEEPRVFNRDDRLVGEDPKHCDCRSVNIAGSTPVTQIAPIGLPWCSIGTETTLRSPNA